MTDRLTDNRDDDGLKYIKEILRGETVSYVVTRERLEESAVKNKEEYIALLDRVFENFTSKDNYSVEEQKHLEKFRFERDKRHLMTRHACHTPYVKKLDGTPVVPSATNRLKKPVYAFACKGKISTATLQGSEYSIRHQKRMGAVDITIPPSPYSSIIDGLDIDASVAMNTLFIFGNFFNALRICFAVPAIDGTWLPLLRAKSCLRQCTLSIVHLCLLQQPQELN
uniref:SFRICE_024231 n=1 Tax=Spodoptera frugiperda TaxID=7108 RepID=A0A2H1VQ96_SPOFR